MKYILFFSLLLSINVLAQVRLPANEVGQVQYQELIKVPDAKRPARQLMEQARAWSGRYFANEASTEQQFDQQNSILFIKSAYTINKQIVRYTLTIETKFGRYRATITDLITESNGLVLPVQSISSTASEISRSAGNSADKTLAEQAAKQQADLYRQIDKSCHGTLTSLKQAMTAS